MGDTVVATVTGPITGGAHGWAFDAGILLPHDADAGKARARAEIEGSSYSDD